MVVDQFTDAEVDRLFHALADRTRRDIVRRVLVAEHSVSALARLYPLSVTAVQKHVAVLEEARLVTKRRHGREQRVAGQPDALRRAQQLLLAYEQLWRERFDRMADVLDEDTRRHPMSVTSIRKDTEQLTMTVTAEYDVTADRAWQLWADPRQLERWWGPPTYPATVEKHDLTPGGHVSYCMTGPRATRPEGGGRCSRSSRRACSWSRTASPTRLARQPGHADHGHAGRDRRPAGGVTMTIASRFPSLEAMEQVLAMGMEEGIREAAGQIDAILAGDPAPTRL